MPLASPGAFDEDVPANSMTVEFRTEKSLRFSLYFDLEAPLAPCGPLESCSGAPRTTAHPQNLIFPILKERLKRYAHFWGCVGVLGLLGCPHPMSRGTMAAERAQGPERFMGSSVHGFVGPFVSFVFPAETHGPQEVLFPITTRSHPTTGPLVFGALAKSKSKNT